MLLSPYIFWPSSSSAQRITSIFVAGKTCPCTAKTLLEAWTAFSKLPVIVVKADKKRFPKLCPSNPLPPANLYWNNLVKIGSSFDKAAKQFLISPGGWTPNCFLRTPLLPPSSETVTIAVILLL